VAPLPGEIAAAVELLAMFTIIGTALFGSQALSDRAFRLLRWIRNRPEPPASALVPVQAASPVTAESTSTCLRSLSAGPQPSDRLRGRRRSEHRTPNLLPRAEPTSRSRTTRQATPR
jgi:hypothetical protein